jgi:thioredoxin 1
MANSFSEMIKSSTPTLVDFYATWCGPCKTMSPILEDFKSKIGDKTKVVKIDVDKNQAAASKFQVRGVPTLILFKDGEIKWRQSGVVSTSNLLQVVQPYI